MESNSLQLGGGGGQNGLELSAKTLRKYTKRTLLF